MALPVSEKNERQALDTVADACNKALNEMVDIGASHNNDASTPSGLCAVVRESELKALSRTLEFVNREKEALDLKEYYQERRLKSMGLDPTDWNPEGSDSYSEDDDLAFGQSRAPGSGLDW